METELREKAGCRIRNMISTYFEGLDEATAGEYASNGVVKRT
jgi:hypothetical protein